MFVSLDVGLVSHGSLDVMQSPLLVDWRNRLSGQLPDFVTSPALNARIFLCQSFQKNDLISFSPDVRVVLYPLWWYHGLRLLGRSRGVIRSWGPHPTHRFPRFRPQPAVTKASVRGTNCRCWKIPMLPYVAGTAQAWWSFVSIPATCRCGNELCLWIIIHGCAKTMRQGKREKQVRKLHG